MQDFLGGAAKPGAANMQTDSESGIQAESDYERSLYALEIMVRRGLIPQAEYLARKAALSTTQMIAHIEILPLAQTFSIARDRRNEVAVVDLALSAMGATGYAECRPYARYQETPEGVRVALEECAARWVMLPDQERLPEHVQQWLPAGAARNALDCAVWQWLAEHRKTALWRLLDVPSPGPVTTAVTISLDEPDVMARAAAAKADWPLLKLKLTGAGDAERLRAVRRAAPKAGLIIDANEAWSVFDYHHLMPLCAETGVVLIEQPFAEHHDHLLADLPRQVPIAADESCHDRSSLARLKGLYDVVNIKLDKTGGLTEALAMKHMAKAMGFGIMIGCMVGSSRAIAPALLLSAEADFVDLDGPLWLAADKPPRLQFNRGVISSV